jgi:hypothetical protein
MVAIQLVLAGGSAQLGRSLKDVERSWDDVEMSYCVDCVVIGLVYFEAQREAHQLGIELA